MDDANESRSYYAAVLDPRTGVYVRQYFEESLRREYAFASRHGSLLSVVLLEVDGLDKVQASWGPKAKETLLTRVAASIRHALRAEDVVAVWQDSVFAVLLRDADTGTAAIVAERLRRTVAAPQETFDGFPMRTTASAGIATAHLDGTSKPSELVAVAERNLKKARDAGGDRVAPSLRDEVTL